MSKKDMLGPLMRALVGVPEKCLGLLLDITNRLGANDGDSFYRDLAKFVREWKKSVESISDFISRVVRVDRSKDPRQVLDETGRNVYCDDDVVKAMPKGEGEDIEIVFFKPWPEEYTRLGWMTDDDLEKALERRSLKACDPYSLSEVNKADPAFADEHQNGTHWKDSKGNWCYATFSGWLGERDVRVHGRSGGGWIGDWWFAGLRK